MSEFQGVWIPREVWEADDITWLDKCILAEILNLDDNNGGCWASNEYLGGKFGVTAKALSKHLTKLRTRGYLVDKNRQSRHRRMFVTYPKKGKVEHPLAPKRRFYLPQSGAQRYQ